MLCMALCTDVLNVLEEAEFFSYAQGLKKFISERTLAGFVNIPILKKERETTIKSSRGNGRVMASQIILFLGHVLYILTNLKNWVCKIRELHCKCPRCTN